MAVHPHIEIYINVIRTKGDINLDKPLDQLGGKAVFTAELEDALINHHIDLAVHSLKDLPSTLPDGLIYIGSTQREDVRDVFVSTKWESINDVPEGGMIATGSSRRKAQLLQHRPDLKIQGLRGNMDTRLRKLDGSKLDGIITAAAAMHRMNLRERISQYLDPEYYVPAAGQGALGIEIAADRKDLIPIVNTIIDNNTTQCCTAERLYLERMEGGCYAPIGCWVREENDKCFITGYLASLDGSRHLNKTVHGSMLEIEKLVMVLAETMIQEGGSELMAK